MLAAEIDAVHQRLWLAVCHYWEPNKIHGHGPDHAMRAYSLGLQLAAAEGADPLVVGAGCYLMDAGGPFSRMFSLDPKRSAKRLQKLNVVLRYMRL